MRSLKKENIILFLSLVLTVAVLASLFCFSAQPGEDSAKLSRKVTEFILSIFGLDGSQSTLKTAEYAVRKLAHFTLYALLGIGLYDPAKRLFRRFSLPAAMAVAFVVACADELHQSFTPGRSPKITDILIDCAGVLAGLLICHLTTKAIAAVRKRKKA